MENTPWVGFGFEGTMVVIDKEGNLVEPVKEVLVLIKKFLAKGVLVKVVSPLLNQVHKNPFSEKAIKKWCLKHLDMELPVTNILDDGLVAFYTCMVHQMIPNAGVMLETVLNESMERIETLNYIIQRSIVEQKPPVKPS